MGKTPKGTTKVLVNRLLTLGWTKWRLAFKVKWSERNDGLGGKTTRRTWQRIDDWSKGKGEANRHNAEILKELLFEECRKQGKWFFDETIQGIPHPNENKPLDRIHHHHKK